MRSDMKMWFSGMKMLTQNDATKHRYLLMFNEWLSSIINDTNIETICTSIWFWFWIDNGFASTFWFPKIKFSSLVEVTFLELYSRSWEGQAHDRYAALGVSDDAKMGEDLVIACVSDGETNVKARS